MYAALTAPVRGLLRLVRHRSGQASRLVNRLSRLSRYGWDMVLWSHLLGRHRDAAPAEFPPALLSDKGIAFQPPTLHVSGPPHETAAWGQGFAAVNAALLLNLQPPDVLSEIRYAHPAPAFRGVYLWDSAFTAQVWRHWDPQAALDVNRAVLALRDDDRLQHVVADFVQSRYTQPPLLAWSLARCINDDPAPDRAALVRDYEALKAYRAWLMRCRRLPNGLFAWAHPYESGIDNSPRFSNRDESRLDDTRRLAAPDFSAYLVLQGEALAELADRLSLPRDASLHRASASMVRDAVNEHLWSDDDGLYYDLDTASGELLRCRTIASLLPLWAGIPDVGRAGRMLEHIMDPRSFGTLTPLPSVARDEPSFQKDMWRGPVWINVAFGVICGLKRYGYWEEAAELAYRLCAGVYQTFFNCRRVYEFYDPDRHDVEELTRKRGNAWKRVTLGPKPVTEFVGWSGLVNTLLIEVLAGRESNAGELSFRPLLPPASAGRELNVSLPADGLTISVQRLADGQVRGVIRGGGEPEQFTLPLGEAYTPHSGSGGRVVLHDSA
ncbi:Glucosidase YgjK precursor [Posidoniimonas corsicana]|uniref:Glucosidase YgjK n=1 Tax=Posidoniimonas corsicana TaxID=1938618 RepID=A0A5C5VHN8_9BACT|nr:trehalase family glycosidase [Posidoniimonas corsicana]TWT37497.1 Glucosidase YgjK precursor [Posidoniimonas corsicana]